MKKLVMYMKIFLLMIAIFLLVAILYIILKTLYSKNLEKNLKNKSWINFNVKLIKESSINKNIYVVEKNENINIYNTLYQKVISEKITSLPEYNSDIDNLLMIYNPYGTNNNAVNIYFKTNDYYKLDYKIKVNGYSDFTKTPNNGKDSEYSKNHSYQLIGFVMGKKNFLTLTLTSKDGDKKEYNYTLDFSRYSIDTPNKLKVTSTKDDEVTDGLFAILGDSREGNDYIQLVDNDGIVRSEIPIIGYRGLRLLFNNNNMYFNISEKRLVSVNRLGQVTNKYYLGKYKLHHDYAFDEKEENLLILTSDTTKKSCEDSIIKLNLKTGKITDSFYLESVFKDVLEKAYYNEDEIPEQVESKGIDWMHINTINYLENDTVIISSRETSSIIKIKNIFTSPKIEYILGDETIWKNFKEKKYLYQKKGDFTISGGQHTVTYTKTDDESVYYLTMFNNNLGTSLTMPQVDFKSIDLKYSSPTDKGVSYYYKYKVDEKNKTFELVDSFKVPWSAYMSSSQEYKNNIIIDSASKCIFTERDSNGDTIRKYKFKCESSIYRVFKYDFLNYYFKSNT